jgi:hypothetical protein
MLLRRLETSLLQDTIERTDWHVHPEFPGHRDRAGLNRMLKLAVTTLRPYVVPPVLLDKVELRLGPSRHRAAPVA